MALLRDAKQDQSYGIEVKIVDEETGLVVDDSLVTLVVYSLLDKDGAFLITNTPAANLASQTIILTGSELEILDETQEKEVRYFTVSATVDGNPWGVQDTFYIQNLKAIK